MDWTQCLTIIGSTIGAVTGLFLITRKDMQLMDKNHREDMKDFEKRWTAADIRWAALFEKFHILDKDMEKFRIKE